MFASLKKCEFMKKGDLFFGLTVGKDGIRVIPVKSMSLISAKTRDFD